MKKKNPLVVKSPLARNRVAQNPLIRKGGVHRKSNKAKRQAEKLAIKKREFERGAAWAAIGSSSLLLFGAAIS